MQTCFKCGCEIKRGEGNRRNVQTGSSQGVFVSQVGSGIGGRIHYGVRVVCSACAQAIDAYAAEHTIGKSLKRIAIGIGCGVVLVALGYVVWWIFYGASVFIVYPNGVRIMRPHFTHGEADYRRLPDER